MSYAELYAAVLRGAVAEVRDPVVALLKDIENGHLALRAVRHPLGFACLPVHRRGVEGICVHAWPRHREPARLTTSPFHCHSWDLLSHVLYGTVGNQRLEITECGSTYRVFEVRSGGDSDHLVALPRLVDARGVQPEYWHAGQAYDLPAGDFHASALVDGVAAATVVLGRHDTGRKDLTLGAIDTLTHRVVRPQYSAEGTVRVARQVLRGMAASGSARPGLPVTATLG
ncbi:MAG TPA: hypothetical protein VFM54_01195 [Micromonosporaceae bacterium]|nr:hypothetical protein [Micromonosporaceae bacterium]